MYVELFEARREWKRWPKLLLTDDCADRLLAEGKLRKEDEDKTWGRQCNWGHLL